MQPRLEGEPEVRRAELCSIWPCEFARMPGSDRCEHHQPMTPQRICPDCRRYGRGNGAIVMAGGVGVCSACGYGRTAAQKVLRKAKKARR